MSFTTNFLTLWARFFEWGGTLLGLSGTLRTRFLFFIFKGGGLIGVVNLVY